MMTLQFIFGRPIDSIVLNCMSKNLRKIFIFGKVMGVQGLAISAGQEREMICPGRNGGSSQLKKSEEPWSLMRNASHLNLATLRMLSVTCNGSMLFYFGGSSVQFVIERLNGSRFGEIASWLFLSLNFATGKTLFHLGSDRLCCHNNHNNAAFSLPDEASGRNVVEIVFVLPVFVLKCLHSHHPMS